MPEKNPSNERMLGKMPENEKQAVLREMLEEFAGKDFELKILRGLAREKTPDEMKIIDLVNERSNEVLAKYELPESIVPPIIFVSLIKMIGGWAIKTLFLCRLSKLSQCGILVRIQVLPPSGSTSFFILSHSTPFRWRLEKEKCRLFIGLA
ncbi:MAG: hypothetical protein COY11_01935 [Candidatus Portnoybacteria bacterium CG_4_10_14_0_2_um_filter_44_20]|uniref:Uncharacterized protein n=1 Tax=Candidatus Portnoybacteria bacterium CG_4_10_14_0_2_um_filter_44_20 TaxID=1974799 RepID=A0A2M7UIA5_9BACT|nr:MAG: hypothetical protein COY11_01935 [Candidatus Portnoybacteria bacterium CG_4_10_14_0_2_um_filter_44_20]